MAQPEGGNTSLPRGRAGVDLSVVVVKMVMAGLWARGSDLDPTYGTPAPCHQHRLIVAGPLRQRALPKNGAKMLRKTVPIGPEHPKAATHVYTY